METYDILMLIVLAAATLFGAIKGFAWQLASIGSIVVSYLVAYHFREPFSESIKAEPPWNRFLAMLILYVGTSLVIWMLFRMVSRTIDRMRLKEFDRQIGAMFGLAKGALYCTLITLFAVTLLGEGLRETIVSSRSGHYIARVLDKSQAVIPPELHEVVHPVLEKFDHRFNGRSEESTETVPIWTGGQMPSGSESFSENIWNRFGESTDPSTPRESATPMTPSAWPSGGSTPIDQRIRGGVEAYQQLRQQRSAQTPESWGRR